MAQTVAYGRTPEGQLMYDLAFTPMRADFLARKHGITEEEVDRLRNLPDVKKLINARRHRRLRYRHGAGTKGQAMKITIESTDMFTDVRGTRCRVWRGITEGGVRCELAIPLLRVAHDQNSEQFDRELRSLSDPDEGLVVDMRYVW